MGGEIEDINKRCTAALRALEAAGAIKSGWLGGQRDTGGDVVLCVRGNGRLEIVEEHTDGFHYFVPAKGMGAHDLSDPVTAASLIVLVREAWGDPCAHTLPCTPIGSWLGKADNSGAVGWGVSVRGSGTTLFGMWPTEAEALAAALEAKARDVAP